MCGLFGYCGNAKNHSQLKKFIRILAIETSDRGTDATGFAALRDDGSYIGAKAAVPASAFVFKNKQFNDAFDAKARLFIGHCRLATHGDVKNNSNNHPHISKDRSLAIVHNGIVYGHTELANEHGATLHSECDSEVVLRLVEHAIPVGERKCYDKLVDVAQTLEDFSAMFSVLVLDRARRCVWSFRSYTNPLVYWESEQLGVTVYASESEHIRAAARIVFGKNVARELECFSPDPGRVARFNDRGRVTYSHREADCTPMSARYYGATTDYTTSSRWADELYGSAGSVKNDDAYGVHGDEYDESLPLRDIMPHRWPTTTIKSGAADVIAADSIAHTDECACALCASRKASEARNG